MNLKGGFLGDLFAGVQNQAWDLGRIMGFLAVLPMVAALVHNMRLAQSIDMLALGGGIAAVYSAVALLIAAKDVARTNAISKASQDATAAVVAAQPPVESAVTKVETVTTVATDKAADDPKVSNYVRD